MAVRSAQRGEQKKTGNYILLTIVFALAFMVVKYFEYSHKIHVGLIPGHMFNPTFEEGLPEIQAAMEETRYLGITAAPEGLRTFFGIYFMMTGVHGLHVLIGIGVFIWLYWKNAKGDFSAEYYTPIDLTALYWHLVDLIWIYLFPLLYLID